MPVRQLCITFLECSNFPPRDPRAIGFFRFWVRTAVSGVFSWHVYPSPFAASSCLDFLLNLLSVLNYLLTPWWTCRAVYTAGVPAAAKQAFPQKTDPIHARVLLQNWGGTQSCGLQRRCNPRQWGDGAGRCAALDFLCQGASERVRASCCGRHIMWSTASVRVCVHNCYLIPFPDSAGMETTSLATLVLFIYCLLNRLDASEGFILADTSTDFTQNASIGMCEFRLEAPTRMCSVHLLVDAYRH